MRFNHLTVIYRLAFPAILMVFFMAACSDSDKSGKNSSNKDTTATTPATTTAPSKVGKKVGKASVSLMAEEKSPKMDKDKQGYYLHTEVQPVYPGGQDALQSYFSNNLVYPEDAINNNAEGTVNVQFAIDENGNVSNARTLGNKLGYGLEEEAVKLVDGMPKWTPGMVKGKKVKAWYTLPVVYKLEG